MATMRAGNSVLLAPPPATEGPSECKQADEEIRF
jgi:hypothetical protein